MFRKLLLILILCVLAPLAWAGGININTAGLAELDTLPGIGPAKAQAIVDHRTQNGGFSSISQITDVSGIGPATYENIRGLITTGEGEEGAGAPPADPPANGPESAPEAPADGPPTSKLNVNKASSTELQTLPGIGPSKAQAIIDDRTNNGPFETCADLTRVPGIGPATVANIEANCTTQ